MRRITSILFFCITVPGITTAEEFTAEQLLFFEQKIRPVLAENCYECHSADAKKLKAGLLLDRRTGHLKGGDIGAAIDLANPGDSLLLETLRYQTPDLEMPPKGKLDDKVIADFEKWIEMSAPWPDEVAKDADSLTEEFDLDARKEAHWCWQPITNPSAPEVKDADWPLDDLDRFILARLEKNQLRPANEAAPLTWLRRVSFDLTGLPPTLEDISNFQKEYDYEKEVERLLASPHYGERWARHWMDLARYAETCGHEFDFPIPNAFRYRDWLIEAFNQDIPYDQFVKEQVAGDLIEKPRINPVDKTNASIPGTGFWYLHEAVHAPTDIRGDEADRIDNQIDVFGKSFLALTIACARCHDHKFDAIGTADYYALAGFLQSTRRQTALLDPDQKIVTALAQARALQEEGQHLLENGSLFVTDEFNGPPELTVKERAEADTSILLEGFDEPNLNGWTVTGHAFPAVPTKRDTWTTGTGTNALTPAGVISGGLISEKLRGTLRSPTFKLEHSRIHLRVNSKNAVIRLVIDEHYMHHYNALLLGGTILKGDKTNTDGEYRWLTMSGSLDKYRGHQVYLEFTDPGNGYIAVDEIRVSDTPLKLETTKPTNQTEWVNQRWKIDTSGRNPSLVANQEKIATITFPEPIEILATLDGTPENSSVHIRGSHQALGKEVARRNLMALGGDLAGPEGSGRLELVEAITSEDNPLLRRVMVNRLWHHLFGRGIVPTVDDFGVMGQPPSHPALLDHLATEFSETHHWSIKSMLRSIVLSRTYRMASQPHPENDLAQLRQFDPDNVLLTHAPVRRLQAEAIRDAVLVFSKSLDPKIGGPSVPVHLTDFMTGRGRPKQSGPIDGSGRRSLYLETRRNFLSPFLLAFDQPSPFNSIGRRTVSNVPAQALSILNDPFIQEQMAKKGEKLASQPASASDKVDQLFLEAFTRLPSDGERTLMLGFLSSAETGANDWADLSHALVNMKEFIFLN